MSYTTFKFLAIGVVIMLIVGMGYCTKKVLFDGSSATTQQSQATPYAPPVAPQRAQPVASQTAVAISSQQLRMVIDQWLSANSDRQGKTLQKDVMPDQTFRVTAIRFPEADAGKWSDNPSQWSQIKIDLNRDGRDDEKWLLKNGRTYKREVLDGQGKVVETEHFK